MFFNTWPHIPRCVEDDVDTSWWEDPDYETEMSVVLPEGLSKEEKLRERQLAIGGILARSRQDQIRAKIYCYECPLLDGCRSAGWLEGHHVWGGLDANERYKVLSKQTMDALTKPSKGRFSLERPTVQRFLKGDTAEEIAASEGLTVSSVMNHVRGALYVLRSEREDTWDWNRRLPTLPQNMSLEAFRHGLAASQRLPQGLP